jgi:hypothetical protein
MMNFRSVIPALVAIQFLAASALPAQSEETNCQSSSAIVVKAKPEVVYNAILKLRDDSKDTVKELSREGQHACVLEETFNNLPIIGDAKCVYKEVYIPYKKIEYNLVRSEKFKAFEGKWTLTPTEDGQTTNLSLSSYVDIEIPVPFAKQITKMQTARGVKKRLRMVKLACEKTTIASKTDSTSNATD